VNTVAGTEVGLALLLVGCTPHRAAVLALLVKVLSSSGFVRMLMNFFFTGSLDQDLV
jgi:hypothetical protein